MFGTLLVFLKQDSANSHFEASQAKRISHESKGHPQNDAASLQGNRDLGRLKQIGEAPIEE
jgi:hypothetical protein